MKQTMIPTTHHRNTPLARWSLCLLLAFAVSSCTQHSEAIDETDDATPLQIGSASMNSGASTYADADRTLTAIGDRMGIFLQKQDSYQAVNNRLFAYATPYWLTDEQLLLTATPAKLAAYYPYTTDRGQNPILMRSGAYIPDDDLSYTAFTASSADSRINLTLNHAYSRLQLHFAPHKEYAGVGAITHVSIAGQGIRSVASLDLFQENGVASSIVDVPGVQPSVDIALKDIFFKGDPKKAVTDFLMIPGKLTGDIAFTATIDGRTMQGVVAASALCGTEGNMLYGQVYSIEVTVMPNALVIGQVSLTTGWETTQVGGDNGHNSEFD